MRRETFIARYWDEANGIRLRTEKATDQVNLMLTVLIRDYRQ